MADAQRCMPLALSWRTLRYALALLMAAMVLLQTAGVIHRVAHAQQGTGAPVLAASGTSAEWAAIWGEHSNSAECQLFDQSCPDLLHAPTFASLPLQLAMPWVAVVLQERFALVERFYAARGPPIWH